MSPNSRGIIPLEGSWNPNNEDTVVGVVMEPQGQGLHSRPQFFGRCLLIPGKFDDYKFEHGDVIEARIKEVENRKTIILGEAKLLEGGKS